jgi:hypothetical protein
MPSRRDDIEAAVTEALLPPEAARLLAVMFPGGSVYQRSLDDLAAEGFDRRSLPRLLRALIDAGFLSKEPRSGIGVTNIHHLHLPPRRQP